MKVQAGVRLSVETWRSIRSAAAQEGISAANLVDALAHEWLVAHQMDDPWAVGVLENAKFAQEQARNDRGTRISLLKAAK